MAYDESQSSRNIHSKPGNNNRRAAIFDFRGRFRFTQYIPFMPAKYAIKILKEQKYTGKWPNDEREIKQGELDMVKKYHNSGRTVYC